MTNLKIGGIVEVSGGTFDKVDMDGKPSIDGDLECNSMDLTGSSCSTGTSA